MIFQSPASPDLSIDLKSFIITTTTCSVLLYLEAGSMHDCGYVRLQGLLVSIVLTKDERKLAVAVVLII